MLKNLLTGFLLTLYTDVLVGITPAVQGVVPPLFTDPAPFEAALASELKQAKQWSCVTGVIVPHHLLAIDVLAKVFASIAIRGYTTVFVLSPDHFSASRTPAATTRQSFQTPFGRLDTDQKIAADLIDGSLVSDDPRLFKREHGIHAVLPFVARLFPKAHVVPIALSIHMTTPDVNELVERLRPHLSDETLVLLSSDFSHYLPLERAIERDQETLSLLAAGDTDGLRDLIQPDHLDSRAGLLIQHGLQTGLGSRLLVIANKNSQEYSKTRLLQTTSYVGAIYA